MKSGIEDISDVKKRINKKAEAEASRVIGIYEGRPNHKACMSLFFSGYHFAMSDVADKERSLNTRLSAYLDEKSNGQNTWSDIDVLEILNHFGEHVSEKCVGEKLSMIGELATWFDKYKETKGK